MTTLPLKLPLPELSIVALPAGAGAGANATPENAEVLLAMANVCGVPKVPAPLPPELKVNVSEMSELPGTHPAAAEVPVVA